MSGGKINHHIDSITITCIVEDEVSDADAWEECRLCGCKVCPPQCELQENKMNYEQLRGYALSMEQKAKEAGAALAQRELKDSLSREAREEAAKGIIDRGMAMRADAQLEIVINILGNVRAVIGEHMPNEVRVRMGMAHEYIWDLQDICRIATRPK